ncbi:hypothetical protein PO124_23980, partial [Bacillus licheniformis]|nr:hypothetical protein [Bacillus licheniformis]
DDMNTDRKELIELLRKLLKALQTAKPTIQQQRLRTEIIQKYSSSDYKERVRSSPLQKKAQEFSAAAKSRENIDKMAV